MRRIDGALAAVTGEDFATFAEVGIDGILATLAEVREFYGDCAGAGDTVLVAVT